MGSDYDAAYEEWSDEFNADVDMEEEWLRSEGIRRMSDVESNFDISWPHYTSSRNEDGQDVYEIAREFSAAVGMGVNASERYHGGRREPNKYVVEPDGSLEGDEPGDAGLEFVSPPMSISQMIEQLQLVKAWASQRGCYTNESTGLHMNISVPNWSGNINDLDYVKLALLLGDEYILDQFGRSGNTYAKSALDIVKRQAAQRPDDVKVLMDKMREHLNTAAAKMIHTGVTSKYTSINVKDGYIEFRSPGGDWLGENFNLIVNTLLRFTVAMDAAVDPSKYRTEYLKKLYAILQPKDANDPIAYFAQYSAGHLPKQALKSFIRQAQLQRKVDKDPTSGQKYWWEVSRQGYMASIRVVATSKEEAISKALEPGNYPDWASARNILQAKPIRPYQEEPTQRPERLNALGRPSNPDGNYVIVDMTDETTPVYRYMAANSEDALLVLRQWIAANPGPLWNYKSDPDQSLGQPRTSRMSSGTSQTDMENRMGLPDQTGNANYEIVDRRTGRRVFVMVASTEYEARRKYADWLAASQIPIETEDYGFREIARPGSTIDLQRQRAAQQTGNWGIWLDGGRRFTRIPRSEDGGDGQALRRFNSESEARAWLNNFRDRNPGVRYDISIREIPADYESPTAGTTATAQDTSQNERGEFTGQWRVTIDGEEVHRFGGMGNNQGDANRIARDWILQQIRAGQLQPAEGADIEVVPVMR
jgi:hypothetical protein